MLHDGSAGTTLAHSPTVDVLAVVVGRGGLTLWCMEARHTPDPTPLARPCGVFVEFAPDLTGIRWFVAAQCTALSVNYADFSVHALVCCSATLVEPAPVNDAGHDLIHAPRVIFQHLFGLPDNLQFGLLKWASRR